MDTNKNKKSNRLTDKFRFSIYNDTTLESIFTFRTKGVLLIFIFIFCVITIVVSVVSLISFTPLKRFIPGYDQTIESRKILIDNALKVDSLQNEVDLWKLQLMSIQQISTGGEPLNIDSLIKLSNSSIDSLTAKYSTYSKDDSLLRAQVLREEQISTSSNIKIEQIEGLHFFPPVKGVITEEYNPAINHPYIDIAAVENSVVSSILDGTVVYQGWSDEYGYTIQVQHNNDIISIYKHNSKILKNIGDKVSAGTPIALVGNTGSLSHGNHLHFELWYKGEAIDPSKYIKL